MLCRAAREILDQRTAPLSPLGGGWNEENGGTGYCKHYCLFFWDCCFSCILVTELHNWAPENGCSVTGFCRIHMKDDGSYSCRQDWNTWIQVFGRVNEYFLQFNVLKVSSIQSKLCVRTKWRLMEMPSVEICLICVKVPTTHEVLGWVILRLYPR